MFELTIHFKHEMTSETSKRLRIKWLRITVFELSSHLYENIRTLQILKVSYGFFRLWWRDVTTDSTGYSSISSVVYIHVHILSSTTWITKLPASRFLAVPWFRLVHSCGTCPWLSVVASSRNWLEGFLGSNKDFVNSAESCSHKAK